jgi:hypothetical protein
MNLFIPQGIRMRSGVIKIIQMRANLGDVMYQR